MYRVVSRQRRTSRASSSSIRIRFSLLLGLLSSIRFYPPFKCIALSRLSPRSTFFLHAAQLTLWFCMRSSSEGG